MTDSRPLTPGHKLQALGACPVFAGIPGDQLGVLAEIMDTEHLIDGELLFEVGEPSDRVFLVVRGALDVLLPGRDEPVRSLGPGDLLGEYGMFAGRTRTATVRASEPSVLLSLDYPRFRAFLLRFPEATLHLMKVTVGRLVAAEAGS